MADLKETEQSQASADPLVKGQTPETKEKVPKPKKATAQQERTARTRAAKSGKQAPSSETAASLTVRTVRKIYSEKERAQKLGEIEKQTGRGDSIKDAIKKAGISEQTYYQWKKAAGQTPQSDELKDLVKLEEENVRLKRLLATGFAKKTLTSERSSGLVEPALRKEQRRSVLFGGRDVKPTRWI